MTREPRGEGKRPRTELPDWLLSTVEGHWDANRTRLELISRFGLRDEEARKAQIDARAGILAAITGTLKNRPDRAENPVGYATFNLVWHTFTQNSFFDKRRTPNRQWLDWQEQQAPRKSTGSKNKIPVQVSTSNQVKS